jgi:prevent-host-death family protein
VTVGADACRESFGYWLDQVAAGEDVVVTRRGKPMVRLTSAAPAPQPLVAPGTPPLVATETPPLLCPSAGEAEAA